MAIQEAIPRHLLGPFWTAVESRVRPHQGHPALTDQFRECFLVVSRHNVKLLYQDRDRQTAQQRFLDDITLLFDMDPLITPDNDFWIDTAVQVTPEKDSQTVLMMKTACVESWAKSFSGTGPNKAIRSQIFPWFGTRDVASACVTLRPSHPSFRGGIGSNKVYNVQKDVYNTPIKGIRAFSNEQLESLAFSPSTLNRWREANRPGSARNDQPRLVAVYLATKQRLEAGLIAAYLVAFGVRLEMRLRLPLFRAFLETELPVPVVKNDAPARHNSY